VVVSVRIQRKFSVRWLMTLSARELMKYSISRQ
jgi:hypothetical protein